MSSEPPSGAIPGWGQGQSWEGGPPDPPDQPPAPPSQPGTGAVSGWGQQPATPPPATPPQPGWGQQQPSAPPPIAPPPAGGGTGPGAWNPRPASDSGSSGCLKALLVVIVLGVLLLVIVFAAIVFIGGRLADQLGVSGNGDGSVGTACPFLSNDEARRILGPNAEAIELSGLFEATIGLIIDTRVLADAPDCWVTADESTPLARVARYQGSDAAARFSREREDAAPVTDDRGGGISVVDSGYFAGDVSGLGDEAFCTGVSAAIQAGVLVREGDTLVYVSLSGPADGSITDMGSTEDGVITAPTLCAQAQEVARAILN